LLRKALQKAPPAPRGVVAVSSMAPPAVSQNHPNPIKAQRVLWAELLEHLLGGEFGVPLPNFMDAHACNRAPIEAPSNAFVCGTALGGGGATFVQKASEPSEYPVGGKAPGFLRAALPSLQGFGSIVRGSTKQSCNPSSRAASSTICTCNTPPVYDLR
jgi:hypothetical protein